MTWDPSVLHGLAAAVSQIRAGRSVQGQGVPSPCRSVCQMDAATGWCRGCLRTLDEIGAWGQADQASKQAIWQRIAQRLETVQP